MIKEFFRISAGVLVFLYGTVLYAENTNFTHTTHFSGSGNCVSCHDGLTDIKGDDVSIVSDWQASMMANSTKDPFWQAKVATELKRNSHLSSLIKDTCTECHVNDLKSKPKKSHLPFGAHKDMFFTHGLNLLCLNCHHVNFPDAFTDHDGSIIPKDQPTLLCRKCHGVHYRDWRAGIHGRINGFWNAEFGSQTHLGCNQCHNPHHPQFPSLKPMSPPSGQQTHSHEEEHHE